MPIYVRTPEGFTYTSVALPFGGVHLSIKGNQFNLISSYDNEEDEYIYDAVLSLRKEKGVHPFKICTNEWDQDENNPGKFWGTGWYDEETDSFMDFIEWEIDEILETDKFGNPIKARFVHHPNK